MYRPQNELTAMNAPEIKSIDLGPEDGRPKKIQFLGAPCRITVRVTTAGGTVISIPCDRLGTLEVTGGADGASTTVAILLDDVEKGRPHLVHQQGDSDAR
jgi:hypothetical protein